jgi:hypothetical protein
MTSIGSTTSSNAFSSPLDRLKNELSTEVQAGAVKSADQDVLSSALDTIDAALKADQTSQSSSAHPAPSEFRKKIDDLISQQVVEGTLTSDQAKELQGLFKNSDPGKGAGQGGPPPSGGAPDQSASSASSSNNTGSSSSSDSAKRLLAEFLANLQSQQGQGQSYGSTGTSNASATRSLLLNFQV